MTLWKLELLRLFRTRRIIALIGVYVFFGIIGPLTARYLPEIVGFAGGDLEGATIEFPPPTPGDGMTQYVSNAAQIGTLVAIVVAAGALAFDSVTEMGIFLRTRIERIEGIVFPRFVVVTTAAIVAFTLGALVAWYETWALIGGLPAGPVLLGIAIGWLFIIFVVALVTAVAGWARTTLGTVMAAVVVLLVLPLAGVADAIGRWLPSHLVGAVEDLPTGGAASDYVGSATVTLILSGLLIWLGLIGAKRREL